MGVKEWTIIVGVVVGVTVLLWLAARWRQRRYDEIYSSEQQDGYDAGYGTELPSGGARTVGYRDPDELEKTNSEIRKRAEASKPRLASFKSTPRDQQVLFEDEPAALETEQEAPAEEQVPLLLDPSEEHSSEEAKETSDSQPETTEQLAKESSIDESVNSEPVEDGPADVPEIEKKASLEESKSTEEAAPAEKNIETQKPKKADRKSSNSVDEASSGKSKSKPKGKSKSAAKSETDQKDGEPGEIIVVNLMISPEVPYQGQPLLRALTELGMRFGDMDIFHYHGKHGDQDATFSMANLLSPGVFDVTNIDELRTHALCFFFELIPDADNIGVYDTMLSVISRLKDELGGEMRDENRSVFTIQTSEHCRNRIRDFQRRHLINKH